ncbi:hypothetical protein G9A89_006969 [Geosiphon pyriformis]|nr:hypothetical protein G9A89_006969 [Geosiphon pyriformis]
MGNKFSKTPKIKEVNINDQRRQREDDRKDFIVVDGRKFPDPENAKYLYPDDYDEQDRETARHYLFRYVWQKNFSAPIETELRKGAQVLDLCCGVGTWLFEMANDFPNCSFYGVDIRENFPKEIKPENVTFIQHDALEILPFEDSSMDFIFIRNARLVFTIEEWKNIVIPEVFRIIKEGGYVEVAEYPTKLFNIGPNGKKLWLRTFDELESRGFEVDLIEALPDWLDESQWENIGKDEIMIPCGNWGGKLGQTCLNDLKHALKVLGPFMFELLQISAQEYQKLFDDYMKEIEEYHSCFKFQRMLVQKKIGSSH